MKRQVSRSRYVDHKNRIRELSCDGETYLRPRVSKKQPPHQIDWWVDGVKVSDHAVVRYLQHIVGVDIDAVRKKIVGEGRAELIKAAGSGKFPLGDGARVVVRDGLVVTIVKRGTAKDG